MRHIHFKSGEASQSQNKKIENTRTKNKQIKRYIISFCLIIIPEYPRIFTTSNHFRSISISGFPADLLSKAVPFYEFRWVVFSFRMRIERRESMAKTVTIKFYCSKWLKFYQVKTIRFELVWAKKRIPCLQKRRLEVFKR